MSRLQETHKYDDIIQLSRPKSDKHPPMDMEARAAQFSAFAALTGHGEVIEDAAHAVEEMVHREVEGCNPEDDVYM